MSAAEKIDATTLQQEIWLVPITQAHSFDLRPVLEMELVSGKCQAGLDA